MDRENACSAVPGGRGPVAKPASGGAAFRSLAAGLLSLLLLATGCPLLSVSRFPSDDARRDAVLSAYFTEEAIEFLGTIPLRYGKLPGGCAVAIGDDWASRSLAIALGFGDERQVIVDPECAEDDLLIFHEYIHQADYAGLLSRRLFHERFARLRRDPAYSAIAEEWIEFLAESYCSDFLLCMTLAYEAGVTRELIAFVIEGWVAGYHDLPDYFLEVYDGVVRMDVSRGPPR